MDGKQNEEEIMQKIRWEQLQKATQAQIQQFPLQFISQIENEEMAKQAFQHITRSQYPKIGVYSNFIHGSNEQGPQAPDELRKMFGDD